MPERNPVLTHRQRQALATRQLIVQAAADLFVQDGYGLTTMDAIAARAGVAVSTVYSLYSNKRGLLKAIREQWHQASGQRDLYARAAAEPDPVRRLDLAAQATRQQWETSAQMVTVYHSAAAMDQEAAAELHSALKGRRSALGQFIRAWAGDYRIEAEKAVAIYLSLTRAEVYQELVIEWGWTPDAYQNWLGELLKAQLLE